MRKYQQLILVIISIISVSVLIVYRSENERLNHVLNVINFFGKREISLVKIENYSNFSYRFDYPLPTFTNLDDDFHGYSAFWKKNDLVAGGKVVAIIVGSSIHSIVQFQCKVHHMNDKIAPGKFGFMRVEQTDLSEIGSEKYVIYKFLCTTQQNYGQPKNLILINTQSKAEHYLPIRHLAIKNQLSEHKSLLTVCLDMNSYNKSFTNEFDNDSNIIQYFLHHELIGITNFIIYNSNINQIHQHVIDLLANKYGIRINILPYNFPFSLNSKVKNRAIIENDCLLRTSGLSKYVMISSLNDYLYPLQKITQQSPLIKFMSRSSNEVNRFEISSKVVCLDSRKKILSDNEKYNIDLKISPYFIEKNEFPYNNKELNDIGKKSIDIDTELVVLLKYIECSKKDGDLYDWRTTLKEKHVEYINFISKELNKLMFFNQ